MELKGRQPPAPRRFPAGETVPEDQRRKAGRSWLSNWKLSEAGERGIRRRKPEIHDLPEVMYAFISSHDMMLTEGS